VFSSEIHFRAVKIAALVGCILAAINHGDSIAANQMTTSAWLKVALTFCVPYCVSWYSSVKAKG
jgi:hypothetical protein